MSKQPNNHYIKTEKRIISLNLEELNLLQSIILLIPTPDIALKIKKQFGIPFTVTEIVSEMRNINSPLYRYLKALQMSIVARCLMLRDENFKEMLKQLRTQSEQELAFIERKNLKRKLRAMLHKYVFRKYIELLNEVAVESMQTIPLPLKIEAREYLIEAHKSNLLRFYLKHAPPNMIALILEIVETQVRMIRRNYELLDSIRNQPDLTPKQKEDLDEWEQDYANYLSTDPEKKERILSHINFDDPIVLQQSANKDGVNLLVRGKRLETIGGLNGEKPKNLNESEIVEPHDEPGEIQKHELPKINYQLIKDDLNDCLSKIVDLNKDTLILGLEEIQSLVELLSRDIFSERFRKTNNANIFKAADKLVKKLSAIEEIDYSELIDYLVEKFSLKPIRSAKIITDSKIELKKDIQKSILGERDLSQFASLIPESQQKAISFVAELVHNSSSSISKNTEGNELLNLLSKPFSPENATTIMDLLNEIRLKYPEAEGLDDLFLKVTSYLEEQILLANQL